MKRGDKFTWYVDRVPASLIEYSDASPLDRQRDRQGEEEGEESISKLPKIRLSA